MTRRPWLVVVVLVLLGISLTTLVKSGRTYRPDDAVAACDGDGLGGGDAMACIAPVLEPVREHVATLSEVPLAAPHVATAAIISLAPKTSPPS